MHCKATCPKSDNLVNFWNCFAAHFLYTDTHIHTQTYAHTHTHTRARNKTIQISAGRTLDDSIQTTIEPRSINGCLKGYFCSDVVFNLSNKVLSGTEINFLGKRWRYTPSPLFINESDVKRNFEDFVRKMLCKWYLRNDVTGSYQLFETNLTGILLKDTLHSRCS